MEFGLCIEMALTKMPFEDRIQKAAELGFRFVEMWFVDMSYKGKPDALADLAERANVQITNTVIGAPDGSIGGGLTNPAGALPGGLTNPAAAVPGGLTTPSLGAPTTPASPHPAWAPIRR